jgi:arylsulfatase A-like enzyme/tetratricopeptide (TPR) repeat protein
VQVDDLNLLLVTMDTTRADRIGAYGCEGARTPTLDRLAREGVLFEQATSTAPLTLPAHASLFTSRFPPDHGVRDNGGFFLDPKEITLAAVLRRHGYATGAFVGAYVLDSKWGLNTGFDVYFDKFQLSQYSAISLGRVQRPANEVADHALAWLEQASASRFFAWVHFYDPHAPYEPPEPFRSQFDGRPYDGEIAFVDAQLGRLVGFLVDRQLLERTLIVVIGDHGESLGEHQEETHGFFLYEGVLRVPLVIRTPFSALRGRRVADVVRSVDVMPTILDFLGLEAPGTVEGTSLTRPMAGTGRITDLETYSETLYPRHHYGWSELRAVRQGRYKVIEAPRPELYDLEADPGETHDLSTTRRVLAARMLDRLRARDQRSGKRGGPPSRGEVEVDPETRARLSALGYVGTFADGGSAASGSERADPKDKVGVFNLMMQARDRPQTARDEDAATVVTTLERVVKDDPAIIDAWLMLGNQHVKMRRLEEASTFFKRALALKPDYDVALINLANTYRELGRDQDALLGYERYLGVDPKNANVRYQAAQILFDHGDLDKAEAQLRECLTLRPDMAAARNALGVIALTRGDVTTAERETTAALEQQPNVRLAHFNLGLLAEARHDDRKAIAEYRREMELHPGSYKAAFNLGNVYERLGDRTKQIEAYRSAIEMNPQFADGQFILANVLLHMQQWEEAATLARKGLGIRGPSRYAALGHYVLADVYTHEGRPAAAAREAARGRALQSSASHRQ